MSGRAITLLSIFLCIIYCVTSQDDYDYGFVIDAGSTGSRIYAYKWEKRTSTSTTPPESHPEEMGSKKEGPISAINSLSDAQSLLTPLINYVKDLTIAQEARFSEFPIYLKATAGMRLLDNTRRINILNWIRQVFNDDTINPFLFKNSYSIIASGSEEATFDWISVNYISNTLSTDDNALTIGALDLGGASTQIAFTPIPSSDIIDSYTFVDPFNHPFRLYTVSHLGYGTNEIARLIAAKVYATNSNENPCLLHGTTENYEFIRFNGTKVYNVTQIGVSGNVPLCESYIRDVLYLNEHECLFDDGEECSINGVYIPHIPSNMKWVAFSAFAYTILADEHGITNTSTLAEIYDFTMNTICQYTYDELNAALPGLYAPKTMCLLNLYIVVLLRDAYHFDINARNILWTNDLYDGTVGWQWGSILYDANLLDYTYTGCKTDAIVNDCDYAKYDALQIVFVVFMCIAAIVIIIMAWMLWKKKVYVEVANSDVEVANSDVEVANSDVEVANS
eukprot:476525_1